MRINAENNAAFIAGGHLICSLGDIGAILPKIPGGAAEFCLFFLNVPRMIGTFLLAARIVAASSDDDPECGEDDGDDDGGDSHHRHAPEHFGEDEVA